MPASSHSNPPTSLLLGAHTSTAGGLHNALWEGQAIGATTIQLFTSNQRQWKPRHLDDEQLTLWRDAKDKTGIHIVMSHDSYLINLGAPDSEILAKSRNGFAEEIRRCHQLQISYLNFHPGAAVTGSREECLDRIIASLLDLESLIVAGDTLLLIECTAGQGTTVGATFEELAYLIQGVKKRFPIGICLDTCHAFAAGYDLRTQQSWDATFQTFDKVIGLEYLKALHLNDSMKGLGSHVDRHAPLGKGQIGIEAFKCVMKDPRMTLLPKYLETPEGPPLWKEEIALLRTFAL